MTSTKHPKMNLLTMFIRVLIIKSRFIKRIHKKFMKKKVKCDQNS